MWNEWWSVRYTMTVVSLVASELRTPVQLSRAAGAQRLRGRAPAGRGGLPRHDIACRLCLPLLKRWRGSLRPDGGNACRLR